MNTTMTRPHVFLSRKKRRGAPTSAFDAMATAESQSFINRLATGLALRLRAYRDERALMRLDDRMLKDMGISRGEIRAATRGDLLRPGWD